MKMGSREDLKCSTYAHIVFFFPIILIIRFLVSRRPATLARLTVYILLALFSLPPTPRYLIFEHAEPQRPPFFAQEGK